MPEVCFARTFTAPLDLIGDDSELLAAFHATNNLQPNDGIPPGRAYTLDIGDPQARPIVSALNGMRRQDRESLARSAGATGDETHRLAALFQQILSPEMAKANSMIGAASTAAHTRLNGLQKALLYYQETLIDLRKLQKASHADPGIGTRRSLAESRVRAAFAKLRTAYRSELGRLSPEVHRNKNRGNALSNADRGLTLAKRKPHARPDPRLSVADRFQARRLATFGKLLNHLGHLALATDAGLRGVGVHQTHQEGGQWMREAAVQATGFGLGAAFGIGAGKATMVGGTALAVQLGLVASGPVGWTILGVIVGVGILAGFGVGYSADKAGQFLASTTWDRAWDQLWDWSW